MQARLANKCLATVLLVAGVLIILLLWRIDPNLVGNPLPPCPFHWLTGLYCPGCGATRALHALVHGDLSKAFSMNPLFVLTFPVVGLLLLNQTAKLPVSAIKTAQFFSDARPWAWLLISYAILRNLPWYPFVMLAPG